MLEKYKKYLKKVHEMLDEYFTDQEEFIACKAGCGVCCKSSYYAISQVEYDYMREGFEQFSEEKKALIREKSIKLLKDRREFLKTNSDIFGFVYECPFLENDSCGIYEHRALLCRSYGLIHKDFEKEGKINLPYCVHLGMNYANVWDVEKNHFSRGRLLALGDRPGPEAYDISYSALLRDAKDIDFGDVRMNFEWVILDIPDYEDKIKD